MTGGSTHGWRKWVGIILLTFLVVSFVFFGLSYYMQSIIAGSNNIAVVAGQPIKYSEFQRALEMQRQQMPKVDKSLLPLLKQRLLTEMVMRLVMLREAQHQGFQVSDAQLQTTIHQMPMFQESGQFSRTKFEQVAAANGYSAQSLLEKLRENILVYQMQNSFMDTSFMVPALVKERYKLLYQKRDIAYLQVDPKKYMHNIQPSTSSIASYYQANKQNFMRPAGVKLQYVVLDPTQISKGIKIGATAMQQYYAANKQQLFSAARWRVRKIIVSGKNASRRSQSLLQQFKRQSVAWTAINAQKDVAVSEIWLSAATANQDWVTALTNLKAKQFSKALSANNSYVILQLLQYSPPKAQSYNVAKERIENTLRSQELSEKMAKINETLSNLAYSSPNTLDPIAKQLNLKLQTSAWITKDQEDGLFKNPTLLRAAFSDSVFKNSNNSAPLTLADGKVVILRALSAKHAAQLTLKQVRPQVVSDLQKEMAQQKAAQLVQKLVVKLRAGHGISSLAKQYNLRFKQINGVNSEMQHVPPRLLASAFAISGIAKNNITSTQLVDGNYAVLQIVKVRSPDVTDMSTDQLNKVTSTITQMQADRDLQLFLLSAKNRAKVKIYKK